MASRPASMRLAMAISPSRESSSTEPISRKYMRTGSSVRSVGSLVSDLAGTFCWTSTSSPLSLRAPPRAPRAALLLARLLGLDDVDAHLAEHGEDVLDLLGIDLFRQRVDLVMGDVAALLGGADELLDGRIGQVEQRAVRRGLGTLLLRHLFLLRRHLGLACHEPPQPALSPRRIVVLPVADSLKGRRAYLKLHRRQNLGGFRTKGAGNHSAFCREGRRDGQSGIPLLMCRRTWRVFEFQVLRPRLRRPNQKW